MGAPVLYQCEPKVQTQALKLIACQVDLLRFINGIGEGFSLDHVDDIILGEED